MRTKLSLVGNRSRSHAGSLGRAAAGLAGFETGILLFELRPKPRQLIGPKVGENLAINIDHRREFLSRELDHLVISGFI